MVNVIQVYFFFKQYTPNDIKKVLFDNNIKCSNYNL